MVESSVAVAVRETELPRKGETWGHGGWQPPEAREALDWVTLVRLLGWSVRAACPPDACRGAEEIVLLACDPAAIDRNACRHLEDRLQQEPLLVVAPPAPADSPLASLAGVSRGFSEVAGHDLTWQAPGGQGGASLPQSLPAVTLEMGPCVEVMARLEGQPLVVLRHHRRGVVATLGFHPSIGRDAGGAVTRMLVALLTTVRRQPTAWLEFEGTVVLRMDDPGGAERIYHRDWCYPPLEESAWDRIGEELDRLHARLSIAYVPGFVDDGDAARGRLMVGGLPAGRSPGTIHPSTQVVYEDLRGHAPGRRNDLASEYRGIQRLRTLGIVDVELHGWCHLDPDPRAWSSADDRYTEVRWFRELGERVLPSLRADAAMDRDPLARAIQAFEMHFQRRPVALVPPGDEFCDETIHRAHRLGLALVDSYYLAIRFGDRFCWTQHVCAPYLDLADAQWLEAGLPVVGYFHDREPCLYGIEWLSDCLLRWQQAGARRFIDFAELAGALSLRLRMDQTHGSVGLVVDTVDRSPLPRKLPIRLWIPEVQLSEIWVRIEGREFQAVSESLGGGHYRITLPADPPMRPNLRKGRRSAMPLMP